MKVLFVRAISSICILQLFLISNITRGDEIPETLPQDQGVEPETEETSVPVVPESKVSPDVSKVADPESDKTIDLEEKKIESEVVSKKTESDEEATTDEPKPIERTKREIATWSLVGLTGACAIAGGVFSLTAFAEEERSNVHPSEEFDDRADTRTIASNVFYGVAGAAAVAALIVWLAMDDDSETQDEDETSPTDSEVSMKWNGTSVQIIF